MKPLCRIASWVFFACSLAASGSADEPTGPESLQTLEALEGPSETDGPTPETLIWKDESGSAGPTVVGSLEDLELLEAELIQPKLAMGTGPAFGDWLGYNSPQSDLTWLAAKSDLGMFSIQSYPGIAIGTTTSFELGWGIHFLDGPNVTDMPPRLFDLEMALRTRRLLTDHLMMDLKLGAGVFSDFEGSARKGVRLPGHAVGYYELDEWFISVLGVDVLDRDDISVLPVVGAIWRAHPDLICELVFPRPKIQYRINEKQSFYIGGELGGGTWAIERESGANDVATYRDIRVTCGVMKWAQRSDSVLEIGYAFDRALEYRSGLGDYDPQGALILRLRAHW